ncbi:MAG: hypothetical protein L3J21_05295 [Devosiaceae bacterium]|nr:hypothetical protein [Devosiaceae bacterium]
MSKARKVFLGVLGFSLLVGLVIGVVNLIWPEAASIELNGEQVEGMQALWTSIFVGAIPGVIFGLIAAGITKLFTRKKKTAE